MVELQTIGAMRAAYDGEWVLIVDCEYEGNVLVRGRVAAHSPSKREVYEEFPKLPRTRHGATMYFGKVPDDIVVML